MLCPKCNQELSEGSAFCNHCGANLKDDAHSPPSQEPVEAVAAPPALPEPPVRAKQPPILLLAIGSGAVAVLVAAIVLLGLLLPKAQDKFFKAIANGQAEDAIAIYKSC